MGSSVMNSEFPDKKQRAGVCYTAWKDSKKKKKESNLEKDSMFSRVVGFETKSFGSDFIVRGFIATTHLDSGDVDPKRNILVRDKIDKSTLEKWALDINSGDPRSNKVSVNHNREPTVVGVGIKGSAKVLPLEDNEFGLFVETLIDNTREDFKNIELRVEKGFIDSFSIEYDTGINTLGKYYDGACIEEEKDGFIQRTLLPGVSLEGWTLASRPMNHNCIMLKEVFGRNSKKNKGFVSNISKKINKEDFTMTAKKTGNTKVRKKTKEKAKKEVISKTSQKISVKENKEYKMFLKWKRDAEKKERIEKLKNLVKKELKEELKNFEVKDKVKINQGLSIDVESKELKDYLEIFDEKKEISVSEQFIRASRLITADDLTKKTSRVESREYKNFGVNGTKIEYKALGITTNQNTDTDYLLSSAELNDIFDPVITNALNNATTLWNIIPKEDKSSKGNNQVQFTLKTVDNSTATAYTGNTVATGNTTRQKFMTKFKKYQAGVEVDGDMIAAARGGPIGDVFGLEVQDATDALLSNINIDLFGSFGAETDKQIIGLNYFIDSASNTTLYSVTRSASNKLSPDNASDNYIDGNSADVSIKLLRQAIRHCVTDGSDVRNLVIVASPFQADQIKSIYDSQGFFTPPVSLRAGFEGLMSFESVPVFVDKDCPTDSVFVIDTAVYRAAIWVPPTLEMLGKDADAEKGFIKTYFAIYCRAPRRLAQIYSLSTS